MRSLRARTILPACLAVAACAAAARGAAAAGGPERILFAGGRDGLWIVRNSPGGAGDEKNSFSVAQRQAGGKWRLVARDQGGRAAAAAVIEDQLNLITGSGGYLTFRRGQEQGQYQRALASGPLAVAGFTQLGKTVLLVVADANDIPRACAEFRKARATRPAGADGEVRKAPATRPAAPAGSKPAAPEGVIGLLVLVYTDKPNAERPWRAIALREDLPMAPRGRVLAAALGQRVYVLLAGAPSGTNMLLAWEEGEWRDVLLTGAAADEQALGLCVVGGKLVLVLGERVGQAQAKRRLRLVVFGADETVAPESRLVKIESGTAPRAWPAGSLPAAAGFGDQLALLWQDGETLKFATCDPNNGQLDTRGEVAVFDDAGGDGYAEKIYSGLLWGLMLAIFAITFIRRLRRPLEPFQLPPGARPAQMPRRIMAAALDLLPFSMVATLVFLSDMMAELQASQASVQEVWARLQEFGARRPIPDNIVYSQIMSIGLYTVYATAMELRFGATLGKKLFKLRVVGHKGAAPGPRDIILRNLVRAIVLFWANLLMLPLLLIVFPLINRNRQRMGDMLAHTAVIDARIVPVSPVPEDAARDRRTDIYTEQPPPPDDGTDARDGDEGEDEAG